MIVKREQNSRYASYNGLMEQRNPEFEEKMAAVLHLCKVVEVINQGFVKGIIREPCAVKVSYDEKPGIQALSVTTPDRALSPGLHPSHIRDDEYKRLGNVVAIGWTGSAQRNDPDPALDPRPSFRAHLERDLALSGHSAATFPIRVHPQPCLLVESDGEPFQQDDSPCCATFA